MNENDRTLTTRQQLAIVALLTTPTITAAAETIGAGEKTLRRWMAEPAFRAALSEAESDLIDAATRRLLQLQNTAFETVSGILDDPNATHTVRLRAAALVLEYLLKLRELRNVERRLVDLEITVRGGYSGIYETA